MKYLALILLLFSFSALSAQEATVKTILNDSELNISTIDNEISIDTTSIIVFNKKKASFYLENFGFEKISRAKHIEFFYKKGGNTTC